MPTWSRPCLPHPGHSMKRNSDTRQKLLVVAAIFGSAMIIAIAAAAATSRPITADLVLAVLLLGSLAAVATYMDVDVDAAIGLSGNTMILIAAIVVFRS